MVDLGTEAPSFELFDAVAGLSHTFESVEGAKGTLVMFICNHCPFVKHLLPTLGEVANEYQALGIGVAAISSNDIENYPDDRPELMKALALELGWVFPYLYDETQKVAKSYDAACTPDFFLYDENQELVYRGQFDESRPGNEKPVTGSDLKAAMDALIDGEPIPEPQIPSLGCNIKWKA